MVLYVPNNGPRRYYRRPIVTTEPKVSVEEVSGAPPPRGGLSGIRTFVQEFVDVFDDAPPNPGQEVDVDKVNNEKVEGSVPSEDPTDSGSSETATIDYYNPIQLWFIVEDLLAILDESNAPHSVCPEPDSDLEADSSSAAGSEPQEQTRSWLGDLMALVLYDGDV
ncbi:hypothetical protein NLI96_g11311 [Meripilus lineatus]|uniref:Uncharacterized protein n=1 Tax=Meripilus lineatus TaxID=2056292 RepID=A0AAD5US33_9APHY|nr:hypothetical protein NLI96_g11311 [Physisporinus lineatus]